MMMVYSNENGLSSEADHFENYGGARLASVLFGDNYISDRDTPSLALLTDQFRQLADLFDASYEQLVARKHFELVKDLEDLVHKVRREVRNPANWAHI